MKRIIILSFFSLILILPCCAVPGGKTDRPQAGKGTGIDDAPIVNRDCAPRQRGGGSWEKI